ncbi:hypothetical protein [Sediminivirga luteola]|uniref:hypothetical protein n=1 Tax=Sediminivirga luteola TaxID=1774748 RepID=UPI001F5A4C65|nr:hypothetical protein [Sediminivirga luteola]
MGEYRRATGYLALLIAAAAYAASAVVLGAFIDATGNVVDRLSTAIFCVTLAVAAGVVGTWLLVQERFAAVALSFVLLLAAGPSLVGSILDLADFLSASGYNGFGALIMIMAGNYLLPIGAAVALTIAVVCAIRAGRSRRGP